MLYSEADQHARQLTISLCDGSGDILRAQQVPGLQGSYLSSMRGQFGAKSNVRLGRESATEEN